MNNARIDVVRCLMNYMIVVLHAWAAFQYVPWGCGEFVFWTVVCSHLMAMAMPTFFLISGYLLFRNFTFSRWPDKMMRRVKRLLVPYLAWNILFVVFYLSLAHFVPRLGTRVATFGLDTVSGAVSKIVSLTVAPIDGPLWFLRVLFLFALFSPVMWWLMRFARGVVLVLLALLWCLVENVLGLASTLHLTAPSYALVCFVVGGILAREGRDICEFFRSWSWLVVGLFACIIRAGVAVPNLCANVESGCMVGTMMTFLEILEAPALISLVAHLHVSKITESWAYGRLKEMSFFVYAGHFLFCSMFLHVSAPLLVGVGTGKMSLLILIFVGCGLPTMAAVYWLGKKVCPRFMKLLDGTL